MKNARPGLRLGVLLLAFVTLFVPFGVGARAAVDCDDFANPDVAQILLDADPREYEDTLDPDGDGIACNEEDDDEVSSDPAYLDAVNTEVETITESIDRFFEVMMSSDPDEPENQVEIADELNAIAAMWAAYPDEAPELDAPDGYDDIDALYQEWVASVGETGEGWQTYWDAAISESGEDHTDLLEAFDAALVTSEALAGDLLDAIEDADAPAGNDSDAAYLDDVETGIETLWDSFVRFDEIGDIQSEVEDPDERDALVDELNEIADMLADYPEVAAEYAAPDAFFEAIESANQLATEMETMPAAFAI